MKQEIQENWYTQSQICKIFKMDAKTFRKCNCPTIYTYRNTLYYTTAEAFWAIARYRDEKEQVKRLTSRVLQERDEFREVWENGLSERRQFRNTQDKESPRLDDNGAVPEAAYLSVIEQSQEIIRRLSDMVWAYRNVGVADPIVDQVERELLNLEDILNNPTPDWYV